MVENKIIKRRTFLQNIARGKAFERMEKAGWEQLNAGLASFEVPTKRKGKSGRIDIRVDELGDFVSIIEIKATNWNKILPHRLQQTAQRHARQVWRYIEKEVEKDGLDVCPGIIYPEEPSDAGVKDLVEKILNDQGIQVVWRKGRSKDISIGL